MSDTEMQKDQPATLREGVRGIWRHIRSYRRTIFLLIGFGFISAIANGSVPYVTGRFFDALVQLSKGDIGDAGWPLWAILLAVWAAVQLIANNIDWVMDRMRRKLNNEVHLGIQTEGFVHLLRLPLAYHANAHINAELSKISSASWRISSILATLVNVIPQFLSVVIGITLAMSINQDLATVLLIGVLCYVFLLIRMLKPIAAADDVAHRAWNDSWNDAAAAVLQVQSVKQASAEAYETEKTRRAFLGTTFTLWQRLERTWSNIGFFQRIIVFITQLTVFVLSVEFVGQGTITIGDLVALNGYALMFFGPFVALGYSWQTIQNGLTSAAHLEKIFAETEEQYHPKNEKVLARGGGVIKFNQVSFRYAKEQTDILKDLSLETLPGEVLALVGESGVGKSTMISLISGYYFPTTGSVSVDGLDTTEWDLTDLRERIAVVPQEIVLFNESIRANIRYGTFNATDAEIEGAARQAHIDDFITSLPNRYETLVGERGIKLSVGQKQRVAIARAILRNPEILILDEPTSALDSQTEKLITKSLDRLMKGRTTFIIAHRLSTVRKADRILVVKGGKIVEEGRHDELIKIHAGIYRHLHELHIGLQW